MYMSLPINNKLHYICVYLLRNLHIRVYFIVIMSTQTQTSKTSTNNFSKAGFHGCYCLVNINENRYYKGRTYVGYTVDPSRRIYQHNTGSQAGGAKKTSNKGPWEMVLITHGFLNEISALRFEWAWQNPDKSRRLKHLNLKKQTKESQFQYKLTVLCHMLNTAPWTELPLTVQWLLEPYMTTLPLKIPKQMFIQQPPMQLNSVVPACVDLAALPSAPTMCQLCCTCVTADFMLCFCPQPDCLARFHLACLSQHMHKHDTDLVPRNGMCPNCMTTISWPQVVRFKRAWTGLKSSNR